MFGKKTAVLGCFTPARQKSFSSEGCLRLGASEILTLYPLLTFFLQSIVAKSGLLAKEIKSFETMACILELLRQGKEGSDVSSELQTATIAHAQAFAIAYPDLKTKPKAH